MMNKVRLAGFLVLFLGLAVIALGISTGEVDVFLILFIPVLIGQSILAALGILLFFFGLVLLSLSMFLGPTSEGRDVATPVRETDHDKTERKFGGVVFIGPIPIVFVSGKELLSHRWFLISIVAIALSLMAITLLLLTL